MSFTAAEKEKIRRYLGYTPLDMSQVNTACTQLEAGNVQAVATVQGLLREIAKVEQQMRSDRPFVGRTFSSNAGGTTQYSPGMRVQQPMQDAARLVQEVADTLELQVRRSPFSGGFSSGGRLRRG